MARTPNRLWQTPERLSPRWARRMAGLAMVPLAMAVLGAFLYNGLYRPAYVSAFALMALGNLAFGLGGLLPEERGAKAARVATVPLGALMLLALGAALALDLAGRS